MTSLHHTNARGLRRARGWLRAAGAVSAVLVVAGLAGCQTEISLDTTPGEPMISDLILPVEIPSAARGKMLFEARCVSCHRPDGTGLVTGGGPDFTDPDWIWLKAPQELFATVFWGSEQESRPLAQRPAAPDDTKADTEWEIPGEPPAHPKFIGELAHDEVWAMVYYIWQLSARPEAMPSVLGQPLIRQTFGRNCATCHGKEGFGDGPNAHFLLPPPRNFHRPDFMVTVANERLFQSISEGRPGTGMPPWQEYGLSEEDRRILLDFVRTFSYEPIPLDAEQATALKVQWDAKQPPSAQ